MQFGLFLSGPTNPWYVGFVTFAKVYVLNWCYVCRSEVSLSGHMNVVRPTAPKFHCHQLTSVVTLTKRSKGHFEFCGFTHVVMVSLCLWSPRGLGTYAY